MSSEPGSTHERHIVVATDEGFALPTAVALRSLLLSARAPYRITVIHDALSHGVKERISRSLPMEGQAVHWVDAKDFVVEASRATHLTPATYFRLFVADALPPDATRAVYLDVDTLVRRDLGYLWEVDLRGNLLGAVRSIHYPWVATYGAVNDWRTLGLAPATPFFNAGVLALDLERWRAEEISGRALEYLRSPSLGSGADQEALNVVVRGRWLHLPPSFNQQTPLLSDGHGAHLVHTEEEIEEARKDPTIVHFQTRPKPWHRGSDHPWRGEWASCARGTDFSPIMGFRQRAVTEELLWRVKRAAVAMVRGY